MSVVAIDTAGARALGEEILASSERADDLHGRLLTVMAQNELPTDAAAGLATGRDALASLGAAVVDKAELAESFTVHLAGTAATLGAPEDDLASAVAALVGFAGTRSLRDVLQGLPPPGADAGLDAALSRLTPALLPALLAGERPELTPEAHADLRTLALALGIAAAGPRVAETPPDSRVFTGTLVTPPTVGRLPDDVRRVLDERLSSDSGVRQFFRRAKSTGGTEVFRQDFWADGRTPQDVLDDQDLLLAWVSDTFELDRRLALATETPGLVDILQTHDFATSAETTVDQLVAEVQESFAAVAQHLPALLAGEPVPAPDAVQSEQIVAFATRVGWTDTTSGAARDRLADALAYLRADRVLASALLPSEFEANGVALPFFDETGIGFALDLGVRRGLVDDTLIAGLGATVDAVATQLGIDLSATTPPLVDESFEQGFLGPLVAGQVGAQGAASPSIGLAFRQVLPYLRSATTGPELRDHLVEALAAFRTLAVVGVPALTERQLAALVGDEVVDVLGRSRLRRRDASFTKKRPEFLALAARWGIPGGEKIKTEKHKFTFSFDELGQLTSIRRKKRSLGSKISDAFKGIVKGIGQAFKENPLKAIFEVGKIALGVGALLFPGTQGLGIAAMAVNAAGAVASAVEGDWLGALSSGLGVFTAGVGLGGITDAISLGQAKVLSGLIAPETLNLLGVAKSGVDTARAVTQAIAADSPLAALTAGAQALSTGLGGLNLATGDAALKALSTTFAQVVPVIGGVGGTIAALDQGDLLAAVGNGLGTLAAGAGALANPAGAAGLFQFDPATVEGLRSLAQTTGVAGSLANAVAAADRGDLARVASFLLQAVDHATPDPKLGVDPLKVATEIANLGAILERAIEAGIDSPALAGPVLQQLGKIGATLNGKVENTLQPPLPTRRPAEPEGGLPGVSVEGRPIGQLTGNPQGSPTSALEAFRLVSRTGGTTLAGSPPGPVPSPDDLALPAGDRNPFFLVLTDEALALSAEDPFATADLTPILSSTDPGLLTEFFPAGQFPTDPSALPGAVESFLRVSSFPPAEVTTEADARVSREFLAGLFMGELADDETKRSVHWLLGTLSGSGLSSLPVVGLLPGTLVDIRDLIGAAIGGDGLGVAASAISLLPGLGDAASSVLRIGAFARRNPETVGELLNEFPASMAASILEEAFPEAVEALRRSGMTDEALETLARGGNDLTVLGDAVSSGAHVPAAQLLDLSRPLQRPFVTNTPAEAADFVADLLGVTRQDREIRFALPGGTSVETPTRFFTSPGARIADVVEGDVLHEVKSGVQDLSDSIRAQIAKDLRLIEETPGVGAVHWHFVPGVDGRMGPSTALRELLETSGIPFTVHLPE